MNQSIVISYLTLRKVVGLLGLAFPVILVLGSVIVGGCEEIQGSISGYYHTVMRDIFVGVLCIVAFFLFAYNGYESVDKIAGKLACFFALGVTFFPTGLDEPFTSCTIPPLPGSYLISKIGVMDNCGDKKYNICSSGQKWWFIFSGFVPASRTNSHLCTIR